MVDLTTPDYPALVTHAPPGFTWPGSARCGGTIGWHVDGEAGPIGADRRNLHRVAAVSEAAYGVRGD